MWLGWSASSKVGVRSAWRYRGCSGAESQGCKLHCSSLWPFFACLYMCSSMSKPKRQAIAREADYFLCGGVALSLSLTVSLTVPSRVFATVLATRNFLFDCAFGTCRDFVLWVKCASHCASPRSLGFAFVTLQHLQLPRLPASPVYQR